jgi:hypothetical protein
VSQHCIDHIQAKQRYNQRVISGVKSFLALDAKDIATVEAFFASQDEGGWEDFSSAGYLLANAFRTSSTKAPDNLPSVKVRAFLLLCCCFTLFCFISLLLTIISEMESIFKRCGSPQKIVSKERW